MLMVREKIYDRQTFQFLGKIPQFRQVVRDVISISEYKGKDENDNGIFDSTVKKPTLKFYGTVKLHGTNASVVEKSDGSLYYQSRKNIITPTKDNAGFAFFAESNKEDFKAMFAYIRKKIMIPPKHSVAIFGEWCGKGIQKGVAISKLEEKTFFIFAIKFINEEDETKNNYHNLHQRNEVTHKLEAIDLRHLAVQAKSDNIMSITSFKKFAIDIDFNNPLLSQNELIKLTGEVENECPVASAIGIQGIGEGIVWETFWNDLRLTFKVKGEKHSISKVKTLASVDPEKLKSVDSFVEYAVTENRVAQAISEVKQQNNVCIMSEKQTGLIIKWMMKDIVDEEMDVMVNSNLELRDVNKKIALKSKQMYFKIIGVI